MLHAWLFCPTMTSLVFARCAAVVLQGEFCIHVMECSIIDASIHWYFNAGSISFNCWSLCFSAALC